MEAFTCIGVAALGPERMDLGPGHLVAFTKASPNRPDRNEDGCAAWTLGPDHLVLAVADGMGGGPSGDVASRTVIESLSRTLAALVDPDACRGAILDGIEQASTAIAKLGVGAGTTIVVAEIRGGSVRSYHVGDSALVVCGQRGRLVHETRSHSPVGYAVEAGLLDEAAAMIHEHRHLVSNMVGHEDMSIEVGPVVALAPRDRIVLASDGLWDNLERRVVIGAIRSGDLLAGAELLARAARDRMGAQDGGPSKADDLTFLLYAQAPAPAAPSK